MRLRIIAGKLGGRTIFAPDGVTTHPMGERVRNAMFNSIGEEIKGAVVLDAFAGSGSVGLEAISRGAESATFLEKDPLAGRIMEENIDEVSVRSQSITFHGGVRAWINRTNEKYDIIFADPPYNHVQLSTVVKLFKLLKPNGLMVLSYPGRGERPTELESVVVDSRSYGTASLAYYRKKDAS